MEYVNFLAWLFLVLIVTAVMIGLAMWSMRAGVYWFSGWYVLLVVGVISSPVSCDHHPRELQCLAEHEMKQAAEMQKAIYAHD